MSRGALEERLQRAWRDDDRLARALRPLSLLHGGVLKLRSLLYRLRLKRTASLPVPVIVVGNWVVGGAGKTPTTLSLLESLARLGVRAGVISRGYGRADDREVRLIQDGDRAEDVGDEPLLIAQRGRVPVAVGRDRVAAARALLAAHPALQVLVSDDGLQHWRLPRQLSILVFDERGLGNGQLLPAGPLRQSRDLPPTPGSTAHQLVLYSTGRPSTALPGFVGTRQLAGAVGLADWWRGEPARLERLHALRNKPLIAAAGLARPQRFFDMLGDQGLSFRALPLPDHASLDPLPWARTDEVVITEKDAIKLRPEPLQGCRIWVVALDFRPEPAFEEALQRELGRLLPDHGP
ncbi:tetraacyldisaccharide 4'-kinase [Roseateles amylovorans]|uniref:Tetraacyldisaccharide 4'-kinase n=1 Tax=Roseateles amylovorans TaxID=2978473 RepID=A0ABY6B6A5_9BURK|nr:tetraacyldisaccharide 4'-kinase [Roseateles amylovorans]UXH80040.1 tetraacyldisaccharide 4'-kinase [Roseateles amylovorans]